MSRDPMNGQRQAVRRESFVFDIPPFLPIQGIGPIGPQRCQIQVVDPSTDFFVHREQEN